MPDFLKKKVAGLPLGFWVLIVGGGIGLGLYLRKRNEAAAGDVEPDAAEGYGTVTPYEQLPSESYGDFGPITGGGPPTVSGGGAIRLDPGTLRIILQRPPRRRRNKGHNCPTEHHWDARRRRCVPNRRAFQPPHARSRTQ